MAALISASLRDFPIPSALKLKALTLPKVAASCYNVEPSILDA